MATFTATAAQAPIPAKMNVNGVITRVVSYNLSAMGAVASAGDVVQMVKVPKGAIVTDVMVAISSSAQSYTAQIGDGDDVDRYFASQSLVLVQAVRLGAGGNTVGLGYQYTAEDTIDVTFSTVTSGTAANADVRLMVQYTMDN